MEIELDKKQLADIVSRLDKFSYEASDNSILLQIALSIKDKILLQTEMGKDVSGKPFKPYNKKYAAKKEKRNAWLYDTGIMLNSMTQKAISNNAVMIFFNNSEGRQKAKWHNQEGAGRGKVIREFFGFSGQMTKDSAQKYSEHIKKIKEKYKL